MRSDYQIKLLHLDNITVLINMKNGMSAIIEETIYELTDKTIDLLDQRGFFKIFEVSKPKTDDMKIVNPTICLTSMCNMQCKYCFRKDINLISKKISFEKSKKFISMMTNMYPNYEYMRLDLTGYGEPLLAFDEVKELIDYSKLISSENKMIDVGFTTNGTLLDESIVKYLEKENIYYGVSMDGLKKQNDRNRIAKGIRSTFSRIENNIANAHKQYIGVSATLTETTKNLVDNYNYFQKKFNVITMKPVRVSSNENYIKMNKNLLTEYKKLISVIYEKSIQEDYDYVYPILSDEDFLGKFIKRVMTNIPVMARCGAASTKIALDVDDNMYVCGAAVGQKDFIIGNLDKGLEESAINAFIQELVERKNCKDCWAKYICGGPCLVQIHKINKQRNQLDENFCDLTREVIKLAFIYKYNLLKNNIGAYNQIYSKCLDVYYK